MSMQPSGGCTQESLFNGGLFCLPRVAHPTSETRSIPVRPDARFWEASRTKDGDPELPTDGALATSQSIRT